MGLRRGFRLCPKIGEQGEVANLTGLRFALGARDLAGAGWIFLSRCRLGPGLVEFGMRGACFTWPVVGTDWGRVRITA